MTMLVDTGAIWAFTAGLICAAIDWLAVLRRNKRLEYVFKPATLVAFIVGAWLLAGAGASGWLTSWFLAALVFSLAGDVFLMLPGERWFLPGLVAFLIAHLAYIAGLNASLPPVQVWMLIPIAAALDLVVLRPIVAGARRSGAGEMAVPIVVYGVILSLMWVSGWVTWFRPTWTPTARACVSLGATLFFASDLMLAWDRFVERSQILHVLVIVTYHLAQLALALVIGLA
ncbi:MAG: lysoplasmalogenase [Anaerolineae bacterium]